MTKSIRKYYYIMVGQIVYTYKGEGGYCNMNTLISSTNNILTTLELGGGQQAIQIRFMKECIPPSPDLNLLDCVIMAIIPLGHMTYEEYLNEAARKAVEGVDITPAPDGFPYS